MREKTQKEKVIREGSKLIKERRAGRIKTVLTRKKKQKQKNDVSTMILDEAQETDASRRTNEPGGRATM